MCKIEFARYCVECCNIPAQAAAGYYMNTQFPPLLIDNCSSQLIPTQGDKKLNIWFCENVQLLRHTLTDSQLVSWHCRSQSKVESGLWQFSYLLSFISIKKSQEELLSLLSSDRLLSVLFYFPPCQLSTVCQCQDITIVADHILSSQPIFNFPKSDWHPHPPPSHSRE